MKRDKNQTYVIFDVVKFILALAVIAIHTRFKQYLLYPWLRVAVPLFFLMSSYLLFTKVINCDGDKEKENKIIKKFMKRNLQLYGFWFVALLPSTLQIRQYFSEGIANGIIQFVRTLLFDSTFISSWFIMATIIGTMIVFLVARKINNKTMMFIVLVVYLLTTIRSSYYSVFQNIPWVSKVVDCYESILYPAYNSFPVALYWVACGKCFAEDSIKISVRAGAVGTIISAVLLYGEWMFVRQLNGTYNNDCYLFLIPLCTFLFALIKQIEMREFWGRICLRKASVIMFALHGTLIRMAVPNDFFFLVDFMNISQESKNFIVTVIVCLVVSVMIILLERTRFFSWLKYSH